MVANATACTTDSASSRGWGVHHFPDGVVDAAVTTPSGSPLAPGDNGDQGVPRGEPQPGRGTAVKGLQPACATGPAPPLRNTLPTVQAPVRAACERESFGLQSVPMSGPALRCVRAGRLACRKDSGTDGGCGARLAPRRFLP